jgi:hypothetical protein
MLVGPQRGRTTVVTLLIACLAMTACASTADSLTVEAAASETTISIHGSTNLPDGSVLAIIYGPSNGAEPGQTRVATAFVSGGRYEASVDVSSMPLGEYLISADFSVSEIQPADVIARFGSEGERLQGPQVRVTTDGTPLLEADTRIVVTGR